MLLAGFAKLPMSPPELVGSYPTVSPLPHVVRRSAFCGTFLEVTPTGRYPAPYPVEFGLSSRKINLPGGHLDYFS